MVLTAFRTDRRPRISGPVAVLASLATLRLVALPALALEESPGEKDALMACEEKICRMILNKEPAGDDYSCKLTKTWAQTAIKNGESKSVKWGFGDARCSVGLTLAREDIYAALTKKKHTISLPTQTVRCEVERENELKPVVAKAAPKMEFKDGKADKVWINLQEVSGPVDIKGTIWAAANLEDSLGIFHKSMIKQINKFMYKKCAEKYGDGATEASVKPAKKKKKDKAETAKTDDAKPAPAETKAQASAP